MKNLPELVPELIANIYKRLEVLFGTDEIMLLGGAAIKISSNPSRHINDIDVALFPKKLYGIDSRLIEELGFQSVKRGYKLTSLIDKKSGIKIEVSAKSYQKLNKSLGIKNFNGKNPTILGLGLREVIQDSKVIKVGDVIIHIPSGLDQILMKYNLWLLRGEGKTKNQKDAEDIRKLVAFYYKDVENLLVVEKARMQQKCKVKSISDFQKDMEVICK